MNKRLLYFASVGLVTLIALGLRLYAVPRLNVDFDEPVYLADAIEYAHAMRAGDLKMLAWSETTYEHPALYKILYGVALLGYRPIDRLPDKDLPRQAPIASAAAGPWDVALRYESAAWGTLAVLCLALVNPLAGLFLGISTLSVKYTSEVYLEALPLLSSLLCALTYLRWFEAQRRDGVKVGTGMGWLVASGVLLGITAASKYIYSLVGVAVLVHFGIAALRRHFPAKAVASLAGWAVLSLAMFFVFDPYLWPHPVARLTQSVLFHEAFQDSRLVLQAHYAWWQPLRWLSAFSAYYDLAPASAFLVNLDTLVFALAVIGLPRLAQKQPFFLGWLVIGLLFLLAWNTKWPQYAVTILAPFCMAAAEGGVTAWELARRLFGRASPAPADSL